MKFPPFSGYIRKDVAAFAKTKTKILLNFMTVDVAAAKSENKLRIRFHGC